MKKYNKLVRDKIPKIIEKSGSKFKSHIADEKEYWRKLKEKLLEETNEFIEDPNKEEISDILEVISAINEYKDWNIEDIIQIQKNKKNKRGGFKKRIILDEAEEKK